LNGSRAIKKALLGVLFSFLNLERFDYRPSKSVGSVTVTVFVVSVDAVTIASLPVTV
jgi:hypothetical protein